MDLAERVAEIALVGPGVGHDPVLALDDCRDLALDRAVGLLEDALVGEPRGRAARLRRGFDVACRELCRVRLERLVEVIRRELPGGVVRLGEQVDDDDALLEPDAGTAVVRAGDPAVQRGDLPAIPDRDRVARRRGASRGRPAIC